jgi:hypothetical protein
MGTISFEMKAPKMRKSQEFIVYPMSEKSEKILIQSDKRWAEICVNSGIVEMTDGTGGHPNTWLLQLQKIRGQAQTFKISDVDLQALKLQIFTTAGDMVGRSVVLSDNSGAFSII